MARRLHKKKSTTPIARIGELATPERRAKNGGVIAEVVDGNAAGKGAILRHRVRAECFLDACYLREVINDPQYRAGIEFRKLFGGICNDRSSGTFDTLAKFGRGDAEWKIITHMDCEKRLKSACALLNKDQLFIVRDVCGYDKPVKFIKERKVLVSALDILASHWGFT